MPRFCFVCEIAKLKEDEEYVCQSCHDKEMHADIEAEQKADHEDELVEGEDNSMNWRFENNRGRSAFRRE